MTRLLLKPCMGDMYWPLHFYWLFYHHSCSKSIERYPSVSHRVGWYCSSRNRSPDSLKAWEVLILKDLLSGKSRPLVLPQKSILCIVSLKQRYFNTNGKKELVRRLTEWRYLTQDDGNYDFKTYNSHKCRRKSLFLQLLYTLLSLWFPHNKE